MSESPTFSSEVAEETPPERPAPPPLPPPPDAPRAATICPTCAAPADAQDLYCAACGAGLGAAGLAATAADERERLECTTCGAQLRQGTSARSQICPFCASSTVAVMSASDRVRREPEFVLPFAIPEDEARARFERWLAHGNLFRPADLARSARGAGIRGVYLPFWAFSLHTASDWQASIGEYWYRTETYTVVVNGKSRTRTRRVRMTEWWPLAGKYQQFHSDYLVSGSKGISQADADRLQPFRLEGLKRYHPRFLAGWLSEEFSVDEGAALAASRSEFARRQERAVGAFLPGDTHRGLQLSNRFSRVESNRVLLPIYVFSYRFGASVHRFLLNGQTGRATGTKPLSAARIALVVAAAALAIGLALLAVLDGG